MVKNSSFQYLKQISQARISESNKVGEQGLESFLCVLVQGKEIHLRLSEIKEIVFSPEPTPLGHSKSWFSGVLKVQGNVYSAVSISGFLYPGAQEEKHGFAVALSDTEGHYAFLVNEMLGIVKTKLLEKTGSKNFIESYKTESNPELLVISTKRLIASSEFVNASVF